jgi:hypothetical protein
MTSADHHLLLSSVVLDFGFQLRGSVLPKEPLDVGQVARLQKGKSEEHSRLLVVQGVGGHQRGEEGDAARVSAQDFLCELDDVVKSPCGLHQQEG